MQASLRWHRNLVGHASQKLSNMIHNVDWDGGGFENDGRSSSNGDTLRALKKYKEIKRKMVPEAQPKVSFYFKAMYSECPTQIGVELAKRLLHNIEALEISGKFPCCDNSINGYLFSTCLHTV